MFAYFVTTDSLDFPDDNGEEQCSLLTMKVRSETPLTEEQAIATAEEDGDWKIHFGEGDPSKVGFYSVEPVF